MANQDMWGTTTYPTATRQQVQVGVPTMEVGKWTPPTYAETPEYAPLGWQMAGVRGSRFGPPLQASVTKGPSDADRQMQRMALEKAQMELDAAQAANRALPSAMRMGSAGQWGMYVDPSQLTAAQQMAGLTGGMYGSPSGGDWRGRATMFGGLNPQELPQGAGQAIQAVIAANAEKEQRLWEAQQRGAGWQVKGNTETRVGRNPQT